MIGERKSSKTMENIVGFNIENKGIVEGKVALVAGNKALVQIADATCWAKTAIVPFYILQVGDKVLTIGNGKSVYILGVLESASTELNYEVPRNLKISAPNGSIIFESKKQIGMISENLFFGVEKMQVECKKLVENYESIVTDVKNVCERHVGHLKDIVKGRYTLKAKRINTLAEDDVKINGNKIKLG